MIAPAGICADSERRCRDVRHYGAAIWSEMTIDAGRPNAVSWRLVSGWHARGRIRGLGIAAASVACAAVAGCGSSAPTAPSAGVFRLTNDTSALVNASDCGGAQLAGCVAVSKTALAPGQSASFALSSASLGSTPNSVAIHRAGHPMACLAIPGSTGGTYTADVSQAQPQACTIQDSHSS